MERPVAVAHYPEGTGHATKMLAVANGLEDRGFAIELAGGGPGSRFVELNEYEVFRATPVDYIGDYQGGSLLRVLSKSIPDSARRVRDVRDWLRRVDPRALVTDDAFAAMAATITDTRLFVVSHNTAAYYDAIVEKTFTWLLGQFQTVAAEDFFYPSIWPPIADDPTGVTPIPPIALEDDGSTDPPRDLDVLVVPSAFSREFGELARSLEKSGHDEVVLVGGPDWDAVPALLPWVRAADVVVCSGYSTVMEAAVAGTPCVVYPFTDEQHGFSRIIERTGVTGFAVEHSIEHVVRATHGSFDAPEFENGAGRVAEAVETALSE